MPHCNAIILFESTDARAVLTDPVNEDWLAVVRAIDGEPYELLARRYYLALSHFRSRLRRQALPGRIEVVASDRQEALQGMLALMNQRKALEKRTAGKKEVAVFVEAGPDRCDESLPEALRDFSKRPPSLGQILDGAGRPPCDALCLMRAFLAAPLLGVGDSPTEVFRLLRSNPTYARMCGFSGHQAPPGEITSRKLPGLSTCEEFSEVMTRYALWQLARIEQVRENLARKVVAIEDTLSFDTTHLEANSHCGNVVPAQVASPPTAQQEPEVAQAGVLEKAPKHRKVPRMRKTCGCGKQAWAHCEHPWTPTDHGAAVVVKGPTRVYWAHKASVTAFGESEIPIDARVLQYGAESDGKTLVPHLVVMQRDFSGVVEQLRHVLADDAYHGNAEAVLCYGQGAQLILPVHPSGHSKAKVAAAHPGISRFTPIGVPVCQAEHRFEMRGRDLSDERYIWAAPNDERGQSVCLGCPIAKVCMGYGEHRHIRVYRHDFPQINWDQPQHLSRNRARYAKRTGVERAIKRIKVDLRGEHLTHRDAIRVQAHLDRKLLTLHLLLKAGAAP